MILSLVCMGRPRLLGDFWCKSYCFIGSSAVCVDFLSKLRVQIQLMWIDCYSWMLLGMGGVWFGFHWCCWLLIEVRFWFLCVCGHGDLFCFWLLYPLLARGVVVLLLWRILLWLIILLWPLILFYMRKFEDEMFTEGRL